MSSFFDDHVRVIHVSVPKLELPNDLLRQYLEAAAWADSPDGENWENLAWSKDALTRARIDCITFYRLAFSIIGELDEDGTSGEYHYGHDFWLTRQGHGAGFWDGDYPDPAGDQLTEISKKFGETDVYLGDDGQIHLGDE
jgi:hypothetical protein